MQPMGTMIDEEQILNLFHNVRLEGRILVAEDDGEMRGLITEVLHAHRYQVVEAKNGMQLLDELTRSLEDEDAAQFDLVISDIRMPGITGLEVLEGLRKEPGFPPMILITAFGDEETHEAALKFGAAAMLDKPFPLEVLLAAVRRLTVGEAS